MKEKDMDWTEQDERRRKELQLELSKLEKRRSAAWKNLEDLKARLLDDDGYISTDKMIEWAGAIRDALAPFDSGMRQAAE